MGNLSIMGLFENLAIFGPLLLLILMPIGFVGSAWITNSVFTYLGRDVDEVTTVDRFGTLLLLGTLFTMYAYFVCALLVE
jgi:hypothetical protein